LERGKMFERGWRPSRRLFPCDYEASKRGIKGVRQ